MQSAAKYKAEKQRWEYEQFQKKYPSGRFSVARVDDTYSLVVDYHPLTFGYEIMQELEKRTDWRRNVGCYNHNNRIVKSCDGVRPCRSYCNVEIQWIKYFDNLSACLAYARKRAVPENLIGIFQKLTKGE